MLPPAASIAVMAEEEAQETVIFTGALKVAAPCLQSGGVRRGPKKVRNNDEGVHHQEV